MRYPQKVHDFIRENVNGRTSKELAELVNAECGTHFTAETMHGYKSNHHLKSGTRTSRAAGYTTAFPEGTLEYVREIASGKSTAEITRLVNEKFGEGTATEKQIKAFKKNHDINTGLTGRFEKGHVPPNKGKKLTPEQYAKAAPTMFKKGHRPHNHKGLGEYSHTTDGYLIRKVSEKGLQRERWEFVHRAVWEENFGPIPEGMVVGFKDGNKDNVAPENLMLTTNREHLALTRLNLRFTEAELTEAGLAIVKVKIAAQDRRKGGGATLKAKI